MNSENSKTLDPFSLVINLSEQINLKRRDYYIALSRLSIYYTWQNIGRSYKSSKFKM